MIKKFTYFVKKRKVLLSVSFLMIVVVIGGVFFWSQRMAKDMTKDESSASQKKENEQVQNNLAGKEAQQQSSSSTSPTNSQTTSPNITTTPTTPNTTSSVLTDVSVQALRNQDSTLGLSLYGPQGIYTIQKCSTFVSGQCTANWVTIVSNQSYGGHGGLSMESLSGAETAATYLIYKIVNGQKVSTSKPITVDRAAVSDVKTFIGE